jgi:Zn-dependent peptidase ImmA (M78 family)
VQARGVTVKPPIPIEDIVEKHLKLRVEFDDTHKLFGRHLFAKDPAQAFLFGGRAAPSFVCRSSDAMKREEWQANFAASCGLMPRNSVIETWRERFGNTNARILKRKNRINLPSDASGEMAEVCRSINEQRDVEAMNEFVRPFAEKFLVSMVAMRIRLERLGLLHREVPRQRSLTFGV